MKSRKQMKGKQIVRKSTEIVLNKEVREETPTQVELGIERVEFDEGLDETGQQQQAQRDAQAEVDHFPVALSKRPKICCPTQ